MNQYFTIYLTADEIHEHGVADVDYNDYITIRNSIPYFGHYSGLWVNPYPYMYSRANDMTYKYKCKVLHDSQLAIQYKKNSECCIII